MLCPTMLCPTCSTKLIIGYFQREHINKSGRHHNTIIVNSCSTRCPKCKIMRHHAMSKLLYVTLFYHIVLWQAGDISASQIAAPKEGIHYLWA